MKSQYPEYEFAVSLAERIAPQLPAGWYAVTAVGTNNGRSCQQVMIYQGFVIGLPLPPQPTAEELRTVWAVARRCDDDRVESQLTTSGACIVIGGAE